MRHSEALAQLARETRRARRNLALERVAHAGFWCVFAAGGWAAAALFGLQERAPLLAQSLSAIAALGALGALAWRGARAWRAPTDDEARLRLAADSKLDSSAFEALRDQPSRYDPLSLALWRKAQDQAVARAEQAHAAPLRLQLQKMDRFFLRYALAAALIAGVFVAQDQAGDRLARAFVPDPGPLVGDGAMAVEAWVTPADYTHAAPVSLSDLIGQRVETPPSIEAVVRVTGPAGAPRLVFEGQGGRREAAFARSADGAWEARMAIPGAGRLKVVRFHTRAAWRLAPARDAAPQAAFAAPIASMHDEVASLAWRASDDYGVRRLALRVRPLNPPPGLTRADAVDTELESPAGDPAQAEAEAQVDLAAHPYAGLEVEAQIVAFDALGQEGVSQPLRFTMPEKVFLQPLARAAIEIRRHVLAERRPYRGERPAWGWLSNLLPGARGQTPSYSDEEALVRAPEGIRRAVRLTDALTTQPDDGYFRDLAVFLGLRLARSELTVARRINDTNVAADTLWRTALRAEYGGTADARAALEEAQRQLAQALAEGAPPERLRQLFDALRRATDNYMQSLVQEAIRNGQQSNLDDTQDQTQISGRDIDDLLRQAEQLSQQGRRAEAQRLLDMLAGILQNLDVQLSQGGSGDGDAQGAEDERMQQRMDQLSGAIGQQRALNNDTRQQSGQGEAAQQLADRQARIRQGLADAQDQAGEAGAATTGQLNAAEDAMRQAENALRRGDLRGAESAQDAALENLRQGAESLAAEMRTRGRESQRGAGRNASDDPLGRPTAEGADGGQSETPVQSDPVRARQIRDDILRRAQDPNRPEAERDYLRRLLDRFGGS